MPNSDGTDFAEMNLKCRSVTKTHNESQNNFFFSLGQRSLKPHGKFCNMLGDDFADISFSIFFCLF